VFRRGDAFYLNCDANLAPTVVAHLKMYKVRRKIDVAADGDLITWAVFKSVMKNFFQSF
jgi:folate-binding Fe-S cluster repair protein YgfZ